MDLRGLGGEAGGRDAARSAAPAGCMHTCMHTRNSYKTGLVISSGARGHGQVWPCSVRPCSAGEGRQTVGPGGKGPVCLA